MLRLGGGMRRVGCLVGLRSHIGSFFFDGIARLYATEYTSGGGDLSPRASSSLTSKK